MDLFPCHECAKEIIQSGIKEVVYLTDSFKSGEEQVLASKRLFDKCSVKYTKLEIDEDKQIPIKLDKNV